MYPILFSHSVEHVDCSPSYVDAHAHLLSNEPWRLTFVDLRLLHGRRAIRNGPADRHIFLGPNGAKRLNSYWRFD